MKVLVKLEGGGVRVEFHLPETVLFGSRVESLWVPFGQTPLLAELGVLLCHCVMPEDLLALLREIAARLGLRESWLPKEQFRKGLSSSSPTTETN